MQSQVELDEIRQFWDMILDTLVDRIDRRTIPLSELKHVIEELRILLQSAKGRKSVWGSVIDVALVLLKHDVTVRDLRLEVACNDSTIYRALSRLESVGFTKQLSTGESLGRWTINKERCPVLYHASRQT